MACSPASGRSSGLAEAGEVVHPVGDLREARRVADDLRALALRARARRSRPVAHFDPSTVTCSDPASGRLGSLSTRRIWSAADRRACRAAAPSPAGRRARGTGPGTRRRRPGTTGSRRAARWTPAAGRSSTGSGRRSPAAAGQRPGLQPGEHGGLHVAGEGGGLPADRDLQVDRDVARRQDVALVAGQPPLVEQLGERRQLGDRRLLGSRRVGAGQDGEPAAGPAERGARLLHPRQRLRRRHVVRRPARRAAARRWNFCGARARTWAIGLGVRAAGWPGRGWCRR